MISKLLIPSIWTDIFPEAESIEFEPQLEFILETVDDPGPGDAVMIATYAPWGINVYSEDGYHDLIDQAEYAIIKLLKKEMSDPKSTHPILSRISSTLKHEIKDLVACWELFIADVTSDTVVCIGIDKTMNDLIKEEMQFPLDEWELSKRIGTQVTCLLYNDPSGNPHRILF